MDTQAARRKPPPIHGGPSSSARQATVTTCTAATATASIPTGVTTYGPGYYTFAVGAAFEISFNYSQSSSTITDPADDACFPAGVYEFYCDGLNTHFKITANATTKCKHWKSSDGKV